MKQMPVFKLHLGQQELIVAAPLFSSMRLRGTPTLRAFESNQLTVLCTMQQLFGFDYKKQYLFSGKNTTNMSTILNVHLCSLPTNVLESMFQASD